MDSTHSVFRRLPEREIWWRRPDVKVFVLGSIVFAAMLLLFGFSMFMMGG